MTLSSLERHVKDYQDRVRKRDAATLAGLASHYDRLAEGLLVRAKDLKDQYDRAVTAGEVPGPVLLDRLDALAQLSAWLDQQAQTLDKTIQSGMTGYTQELATAYGAMFAGIVQDAVADTGQGFRSFVRAWQDDLVAQVDAVLQATTSASAVALPQMTQTLSLRQLAQVRRDTLAGIVQGLSYRDIKRQIHQTVGRGLTNTYTWVRTEGNRALRNASQSQGAKFGVTRWRRSAALSARTCVACLVADGTIYEQDTRHDFHVNCRCALVPLLPDQLPDGTKIDPAYNRQMTAGRDWFNRQQQDVQKRILGPLYDPWLAGEISLDDCVQAHESPTWGRDLRVASLAQAKAQAGVQAKVQGTGGGGQAARVMASRQALDDVLAQAGIPADRAASAREYLNRWGLTPQTAQLLAQGWKADPQALQDRAGDLRAALDVYKKERAAFVDPAPAIQAGRDYVRGLNVDPDTAAPAAVVRAVRMHGQDPAPAPTFRAKNPAAHQAANNARQKWQGAQSEIPVRSPLVRHGLQQEIPVGREGHRAYHSGGSIYVSDSQGVETVFHEVFHAVEYHNPEITERYARWVIQAAQDAGAKKPVRLSKLFPGWGYKNDEITYQVPGMTPYTTKVYANDPQNPQDGGNWRNTEVATMWMTEVLTGKWGPTSGWSSDQEREWFYLVLGTLVGE